MCIYVYLHVCSRPGVCLKVCIGEKAQIEHNIERTGRVTRHLRGKHLTLTKPLDWLALPSPCLLPLPLLPSSPRLFPPRGREGR